MRSGSDQLIGRENRPRRKVGEGRFGVRGQAIAHGAGLTVG